MATQKHNTYYNENTPDSGLYYYNENGEPKKVEVGSTYSAGSGIKIENDIISVSGKYVASADSALDGKQLVLKDNKWIELVLPPSSNWLPTITEASANAYNSAIDWTTSQGYLTAHQIIPSAKWENASDVVESNSSKWNGGYTTLKTNSADWLKEDDITPLATKAELNTVSSTLNTNKLDKSVFDEYKDFVDDVLAKKQEINLIEDITLVMMKTGNTYSEIMTMPILIFKNIVKQIIINEMRTDDDYNLAYLNYQLDKYKEEINSGKAVISTSPKGANLRELKQFFR